MKRIIYFKKFLFAIIFIPLISINSQDLTAFNMIGKKLSAVIADYGKPVHHDKSNLEMECVFYKEKDYQMVFVANQKGVYHVQGFKIFNDKNSAHKTMNKLLADCSKKGFKIDTLNVSEFDLRAKNIEVNISMFENPHSHKYEIKIDAFKREG
ncbi:MAG: hypothetical protein HND52_02550 [Ignavibacteriae bacterium]|nr:hypothetical protein [Ignavibacteriota bacterium]NOG96830.1 hypothetical protein [Ignavibacteriota bacterium]